MFQSEIQSRGEDVGDGTQSPSSSEAVSGGVAEVAFGVTSVSATEGGQVTSRLSAPTGRVSDSNLSSAGILPRPFLPLDVMPSTMVTDPGRTFLPSLHTPAAAPIFSLGDFTDSFGRVASVTVQERPVAGMSVAPQAVARQPVTMQSEAACAIEGRSQICNTGVTSAYGHVVIGIYRPYDNANGAQAVANILQPVSNMSSMWQPGSSASAILPPVSNVNSVGQSVPNMSTICILFRMLGKLFQFFPNLQQVFGNQCSIIQMLLVIFRNWVLLEILPRVLRRHLGWCQILILKQQIGHFYSGFWRCCCVNGLACSGNFKVEIVFQWDWKGIFQGITTGMSE